MQCINAWAAQELITERMLLDMISLKHQHVEFGCHLLTNRNPTWDEMLKIAKTADDEAQVRQEIHTKRNTPAIRRINDSYSGEETYSLGDESDDSTTAMTDVTEVFLEQDCQAHHAYGEYCKHFAGKGNSNYARYVRRLVQSRDKILTVPLDELPHKKNVYCRERGQVPNSICPFHAIRHRGCRPMRSECYLKDAHKERSQQYCSVGGTAAGKFKCSLGATCSSRHVDDEYVLWVMRSGGVARRYVLRDTKNPWSIHYNSKKTYKGKNNSRESKQDP